jgi:hypothetical protein
MTGAQIFDGHGVSLSGGPSLFGLDLRAWPCCQIIMADGVQFGGTVDLTLLAPEDGQRVPEHDLAPVVICLDRNGIVAVHAGDAAQLWETLDSIFAWCGGGHA